MRRLISGFAFFYIMGFGFARSYVGVCGWDGLRCSQSQFGGCPESRNEDQDDKVLDDLAEQYKMHET